MRIFMRNKKSQELVTSPFSGWQICSNIFFSDSLPDHFDALIQRALIVLFQKLQLVIYGSNFMMLSLFHF